jgi:Xaa-Pro aminopeptidase
VRYRAASDHVYLTGYEAEGAVLVLDDDGATLYLEPPSGRDGLAFYNDTARGELWVGPRPALDEVAAALALDVRPLSALEEVGAPARVLRNADPGVDAAYPTDDSFPDRELLAVLSELRLVKDQWEIAQIETAVAATIAGFEDVGRALAGQINERSVETVFALRARRDGNDVAFNPIAAGGAHATTLHWTRNDSPLRSGELLLLDAGVESRSLYAADLTRTYPVSGRFSDVQRRALELLNDAQDAALAAIGPGRPFRDFRYAIAAVMSEGLAGLGISTDGPDDLYRRFTICGPGHMLGLDVHDCGHARAATYLDGVLEPGHVLTVEPGLYFQANDLAIPEELRGIGLRVEDDVVVTEDGIRNLSEGLPRRAAEIEEWLAGLATP